MTVRENKRSRLRGLAPALVVGLCAFAGTAQAQFFGDRFYNNEGGGFFGDQQRNQRYQRPREDFSFPFGDRDRDRFIRPAPPPADYSKAPPPRKLDTPPTTSIVVIGDSMADWLAYGLDETYSDQQDTGVVRKVRPTSGLIRYDAKNDTLDWSQAVKDTLAGEKPNAIVVMLGLNDRVPLKERVVPKPVPPKPGEAQAPGPGQAAQGQAAQGQASGPGQTQGTSGQPQAQTQGQAPGQGQPQAQPQGQAQSPAQGPAPAAAQAPQAPPQPVVTGVDTEGGARPGSAQPVIPGATYEFHTDKWAELYGRRIDEMITALKAKGVPILWVGLPALRGTKSTGEMAYLDEIFRERADKAGIAYIDIWDGFVDEQGRYTVQGPDFEGQTRKLRTPDGVFFTRAGAVKLASYVDQELRRVMAKGVTPVALPVPDATAPKPAATVGTHPDVGPVVPLVSGAGGEGGDLLGSGKPAQVTSTDPVAAKVLTRGDAISAPTGRADDFTWPHRGPDANAASSDTGPPPAPQQAAPAVPAPKKGADGKAADAKAADAKATDAKGSNAKASDAKTGDAKTGDAKTGDAKTKPAPDQATPRPRRAPSASLDGAPRPPKDVGGGF
jgi:uncharacterized protein